MSSRAKDIILLLGAGASADAGIPTSKQMISKVEELLEAEWKDFIDLYRHVRSAILYADGLKGNYSGESYNIEKLVNTLYEIERNEDHPLYPFIASWNARFVHHAGTRFERVQAFRHKLLEKLKHWVCPDDPTDGEYYGCLRALQQVYTFPLRVFSLNYDRYVERLAASDFVVETGFDGEGPRNPWSYERFIERGDNPLPQIYLYKLHGSIDWKRDPERRTLSRVDQVLAIPPDEMEIIFGREAKLEAADPYLFYAYEFRQYALAAKLVVAIGYGFEDEHINKILHLALCGESPKKLIAVGPAADDQQWCRNIADRLRIDPSRIKVDLDRAKEFLTRPELGNELLSAVPQPTAEF